MDSEKKIVNKQKQIKIEIKSLDVDKAEYQEIILSNSNHPEKIDSRFRH